MPVNSNTFLSDDEVDALIAAYFAELDAADEADAIASMHFSAEQSNSLS